MRKLRLSLDDISVDSFPTLSRGRTQGTVAAHGYSDTTCFQVICDCWTMGGHTCDPTCQESCNGTCNQSCNGTCDNTCNGCPNPSDGGTCWTCGSTCEGYSCQYCTHPGQIICDP